MTYYFPWRNSRLSAIIEMLMSAADSSDEAHVRNYAYRLGGYSQTVRNHLADNQTPGGAARREYRATLMVLYGLGQIREGVYTHLAVAGPIAVGGATDLGEISDGIHLYGHSDPALFGDSNLNTERWQLEEWAQLEEPSSTPDEGIVVTRDQNLNIITLTPELLETLPAGARNFAVRVQSADARNVDSSTWLAIDRTEYTYTSRATTMSGTNVGVTAEALVAEARTAYREWLRMSMGRTSYDPDAVRKQKEAREAAAQRFSAFVRRTPDTERHVPTLPFVPHGLSSSRRWGIEVESGGARGVQAPAQWRRVGDGSLRSAWDGYVEVQDFEPFDEEVTQYVRYSSCPTYGERHIFEEYFYDETTGRDGYRVRADYVNPEGCEACGEVTSIVHRVPETIRHRAQSDDCGEFVSPILVSMHSNGLQSLIDQLKLQPQNKTAGVHVHVEADDLSDEQVATLIFGYDILEPLLEASYQREARRYCQRRGAEQVLETARKLRGGNKPTRDDVRGGDRYVTLNTTALNSHGTIEFRAMGPVYDYDYLVRWAMLCRELVNVVAAGVTTKRFSKIKSWSDLTMLLAEYGKEYMRAVVYEQTGDTGTAADLVKREQPVTTEALNTDWQRWVEGLTTSDTMFRNITRQMANFAGRVDDLVTIGAPSTSGRNATWQV